MSGAMVGEIAISKLLSVANKDDDEGGDQYGAERPNTRRFEARSCGTGPRTLNLLSAPGWNGRKVTPDASRVS